MVDLPDFKQLKKLADACRKAGIKTFKGHGLEFTLTEDLPPPSDYKRKKAETKPVVNHAGPDRPETDQLTEDELLYWSVGGIEMDAG